MPVTPAERLLRFCERHTKLDMVYLASGGFWITLGQVVSNILSLVLLVAFANLLPPETYGHYRYILSLAGVLGIFSLTGMNSAVSRAVAQGHEGALRASVRYQLQWNIIMCCAFLALAGYYYLRGDMLFTLSFMVLGVCTPATLAFNTYGAYLEGKKQFRFGSISTIFSSLLYTAGMLGVLLLGGEVLWLIVIYAGATLASTALFYFLTLKLYRPKNTSPGEALAYGRELTFIGFIKPIAGQIDKILLTQFWGTAHLAIYAIVVAIVDRPATLIKNWVGLAYPKLAEKTAAEIDATIVLRLLQGFVTGALATGAFIVVSPYLFYYLLPQYMDAVPYANLFALSMLFNIPGKYLSTVMHAQRMVSELFVLSILGSLIQIALYVALGISGGIEGLVIAYILNSAIALLMQLISWQRHAAKAKGSL